MRDEAYISGNEKIYMGDPLVTPAMMQARMAYMDELHGKNADQIAAILLAGGFKGKRNSECECPLAFWWKAKSGGLECRVKKNCIEVIGADVLMDTSRSAGAFVRKFDAGKYPELEVT